MLLLFFSTSPRRVRGWTCICAYMCAEWEQGHSWGLGFLSEHHLQASLRPTGEPRLCSMSSLLSDCSFFLVSYYYCLAFCESHWLYMNLSVMIAYEISRAEHRERKLTELPKTFSGFLWPRLHSKPYRNACPLPLGFAESPYLRPHTSKTGHFQYLTGTLRKMMALPVGISSPGSVFILVNKHKPSYQVVKLL